METTKHSAVRINGYIAALLKKLPTWGSASSKVWISDLYDALQRFSPMSRSDFDRHLLANRDRFKLSRLDLPEFDTEGKRHKSLVTYLGGVAEFHFASLA